MDAAEKEAHERHQRMVTRFVKIESKHRALEDVVLELRAQLGSLRYAQLTLNSRIQALELTAGLLQGSTEAGWPPNGTGASSPSPVSSLLALLAPELLEAFSENATASTSPSEASSPGSPPSSPSPLTGSPNDTPADET